MKRNPSRRDTRKYDRKEAALTVKVRIPGHRIQTGIHLDSGDVSEGGAFLRSDLLFEIGDVLQLEIPLPGGPVVKATGRVARIEGKIDPTSAPGIGVEFTKLSMQDRRALAATSSTAHG
jgi:hypothetical protein